jgi:hypothetical protein
MSVPAIDLTKLAADQWLAYAEALARLHTARDAAVNAHRVTRTAQAKRTAELAHLTNRLGEQHQALLELAARLRAPLTAADLAPAPVPACDSLAAAADLRARLAQTDAAFAAAERVARLPQLLPEWSSPLARAAVVYAGFGVPNLLLTVAFALTGQHSSWLLTIWFLVIWPAVTAFVGGYVVTYVSQPRAARNTPAQPVPFDFRRLSRKWGPPYRRFGMIIAWLSWLIPGIILEPDARWPF